MSDPKKISALPAVTAEALALADKIPVVAGGVTSYMTAEAFRDFILAGIGGELTLDVGLELAKTTSTQGTQNRLSIQAADQSPTGTGTAEVQIIPSPAVNQAGMNAQMIIYGKTGADYSRFAISQISSEIRFDSTANFNGVVRNIPFIMGGYESYQATGKARTGQNAMILVSDASVRLRGSQQTVAATVSEAGGTFGQERTTIYDFGNTGDSRLIIATRPNGVDDDTDFAGVQLVRGNSTKWLVGLNAGGDDDDSFDFYAGGANRMKVGADGTVTATAFVGDGSGLTGVGGGGGGSTSPGGVDTQIQYNNGGLFGGVAPFTYNDATGALAISAAVAADKVLDIRNSHATGFGLKVRAGADSNYALKVTKSDNTADVFTVLGQGNMTLGDVGSTLDQAINNAASGVHLNIEGTAADPQAGIYLTSGDHKLTSMLYMTGSDRGMRLSWNYREPYQSGGLQMHSDPAYPVIQTQWETDGAWSVNYTRRYALAASTYDGGGKTFKLWGGGFNPGSGPYEQRGKYTTLAVGNKRRGFDFMVTNGTNTSDFVQRLVIEPSHEADDVTPINNAIKIWVGGALKTIEVGAADSGGSGYRMLRVTN